MLYAQVAELKLLCKANDLTQVGTKITLQMKLAVNGIGPMKLATPARGAATWPDGPPALDECCVLHVMGKHGESMVRARFSRPVFCPRCPP